MKYKAVDGVGDSWPGQLRHFLPGNIVKITIASVGMFTAGYGPDTVISTHQFGHYFQVRTPVVLDIDHFLFGTIGECFSWLAISHAAHIHRILKTYRIVLWIYEQKFTIQKLVAILNEETSPFLTRILFVAAFNWILLIKVRHLPYIAGQNVEEVNLSARKWHICKDTRIWHCE